MKANAGLPPAMLSKISKDSDNSAYNETLTKGPYRLQYFPSKSSSDAYMISVICQSYGDACIRSFLLDDNGEIHETPEPRQPTTQDPLVPDCEKYAQTCRDIEWAQP